MCLIRFRSHHIDSCEMWQSTQDSGQRTSEKRVAGLAADRKLLSACCVKDRDKKESVGVSVMDSVDGVLKGIRRIEWRNVGIRSNPYGGAGNRMQNRVNGSQLSEVNVFD